MNVSVVIPAHDAAATIDETLASLLAQTFSDWEAIVVDDGSHDATAAIALSFAERDARIHTMSQPQTGVSAARNTGISLARFDWLLFLDADDWLLPTHLDRLTAMLVSDPHLDAVHCGWARIATDGTVMSEQHWWRSGDLFPDFARFSPLPIHTCVVRRSLVEAVGGFDTSLRTCEDWDLWQRIARMGARFGAIREALAVYRVRPNSASLDAAQFLADGLRVLAQGRAPDVRVPNPDPAHAAGLPAEHLPGARLRFACWPAGVALGRGDDARFLLDSLADDCDPSLDPEGVAKGLLEGVLHATCAPSTRWDRLWCDLEQRMEEFLLAIEAKSMAPGLARRVRTILDRLMLEHSRDPRPLTIGTTHAVRIEITEPISDVSPPTVAQRLHCTIALDGSVVGTLELPVCGRIVSGYVLADAIAAEFAWPILGHFFQRTVYQDFSVHLEPGGLSIWRGALCLAQGLPSDELAFWSHVHDRVGWTVLLQELWGRQNWPNGRFYDPKGAGEAPILRHAEDSWLAIEVSEDLADMKPHGRGIHAVLMVGGVALGVVTVPAKRHVVRAHDLRVALTLASGFELCRAAVREGLLGRPIAAQPTSIRDRLAAAAAAAAQRGGEEPSHALGRALSPGEHATVFCRRSSGAMGTSISRRATLPVAAARELLDAAAVAREAVLQIPRSSSLAERMVYAPDLILRPLRLKRPSAAGANGPQAVSSAPGIYGREHFETIFAKRPDPWRYTTAYEQTKYEQTLALLPSTSITRGLELGCAEGHFTAQLAPRVEHLVAADISQIALDRAATRCADLGNVRFVHLDLAGDPLPGRFQLIVCSEVLYFIGGQEALQAVARKLVRALEPGGYLLTAHANPVVDEPNRTGFEWDLPFGAKVIGEALASTHPLQLVKELRTPLYRIQLFQRERRSYLRFHRRIPEVIELAQPMPRDPEIAAQVLWHGGRPRSGSAPPAIVTDQLPILMYHRVAPTGLCTLSRYRVTPEAFEGQLRYLHDSGFYCVGLEDWHAAVDAKRPLPGRAVLITFDDGYRDFLTHAWPLLRRYGFSATVFLVAERIGRSNSWDHMYREEVALLSWEEIRHLHDEGVEFGSHSASHRPLTALSPEEVVREGAGSRAILARGLGSAINAFAYPYGDVDRVVQHLIGACGYIYGLSCRPGLWRFPDSLLALPRIEVSGSDGLREFVAKIGR